MRQRSYGDRPFTVVWALLALGILGIACPGIMVAAGAACAYMFGRDVGLIQGGASGRTPGEARASSNHVDVLPRLEGRMRARYVDELDQELFRDAAGEIRRLRRQLEELP